MDKAVEVTDISGNGFVPLASVNNAQIALLSYIDELKLENIEYVEAHNETDEIFMLLEGKCYLICARVESGIIKGFDITKMQKNKLYNVKQGVFHHHVLTMDAKVLIYENKNTNYFNSTRICFDDQAKKMLIDAFDEDTKI
ncbi:MAG TPA: hypothetical protein GXZ57_05040 [Acholeplasmataceae bacterium]|jgi:hypothetical protein|nr:hypothetical protein [Acholeplasmataceae bacterium]